MMRYCVVAAAIMLLIVPSGLWAAAGFDPVTATNAYVETLSGEARERSDNYFEGGYWLLLWGAIVGVFAEWIVLRTRLSARFRDWAERLTKRRWLIPGIYAIPYVIVSTLIVLPWTIYTGFFRERQYELMNLGFGEWLGEQAIGLGIGVIAMTLFLMALFAVIRRSPKGWWIWGSGVVTGFIIVGIVIAPVFISPLFNDYTPMEDGPLRDRILTMAAEHDVPADNVYVFDQSRQHDRISANVSGLFGTMRISLNDNLLERGTPEEVEAVMGHELGHYVLNHVVLLVVVLSLIFGLGLFVTAKLAPRLLTRYGEKWGVRDVSDPAAFPVFVAILTVYFLVMTPAQNTLIRTVESQADAFGLDAARQPDGFASVAMKLSQYRKIEPGALEEFLFFDHPSGRTRVQMSMDWKAENIEDPQMIVPTAEGETDS